MVAVVDKLNEFRGTRPAQLISATGFLGLGLYNVFFDSGGFALVIGVLFFIYGSLAFYRLFAGESIVQSVSS